MIQIIVKPRPTRIGILLTEGFSRISFFVENKFNIEDLNFVGSFLFNLSSTWTSISDCFLSNIEINEIGVVFYFRKKSLILFQL